MLRSIKAFALAAMLSIGTAVSTGAVIVHVSGGMWDHGSNWSSVWSHYYHNGVRHGSSAVGTFTANSGCVNKNLWSHASAPAKKFGVNQTYYRHC